METLSILLQALAVAIFLLWCFQWLLHLIAIIYGTFKLHRKSVPSSAESVKGISILKPLVGIDPNLYANLETFFTISYPKYELLFCIENDSDPAAMVITSLLEKYPSVDARLFCSAQKVGTNPKINNMSQGYAAAKYELVLISDGGIKTKEDTLWEMVLTLDDQTGLVHQMPFICDKVGFSANLEKIYFGTQHAKMYLIADLLGINCVTGMSCLFRKDVLDKVGGLKSLGIYLAEDYYLGQIFLDQGMKVRVCSQPALQNAGSSDVCAFQARMMRWIKLRTSLVPFTAVMEPISECLILGILASFAVSQLFHWSGLAFFFVHVLIWFLLDYLILLIVQGGCLPFSKWEYVIGWLFRELTSFYLMMRAHCTRTLTWRSRTYLVLPRGIGEEIKTISYV
jgi:ceramide glucosyltransferase